VFGFLGIVLGPLVFATADAIMQILREPTASAEERGTPSVLERVS
jgi:hypothetical protein